MATTRDQQRLMKMDAEIMELKYLYEREIEEETRTDKSIFLCSRGIRHRLDKMIKARNLLCANMKGSMNSTHTFTLELAQRKDAVRKAEDSLRYLQKDINDAGTMLATLKLGGAASELASNAEFHYKRLCRELPIAERRIRDKERALNNWLERGKEKCLKQSNDKLGRFYDVQKDVDQLYGQLPNCDIKDTLDAINKPTPAWMKDIADTATHLENNPGSYSEPKAIDNYAESLSMVNNAPLAQAITASDIREQVAAIEFRETLTDNSDSTFVEYLKNRKESEETNVPDVP